jgi:hypothetical protein
MTVYWDVNFQMSIFFIGFFSCSAPVRKLLEECWAQRSPQETLVTLCVSGQNRRPPSEPWFPETAQRDELFEGKLP